MLFQQPEQKSLLPLLLASLAEDANGNIAFFSPHVPSEKELSTHKTIYFLQDQDIICSDFGSQEVIGSLTELPNITFAENWLIVVSALHQLGLSVNIDRQENGLILPAHRLEKVATINGVDFYNDSKSTHPAATLAAVEKLRDKKIHLLLGGKSKGIDRTDLIAQLQKYNVYVYAFGVEAAQLQTMCDTFGVTCNNFSDMQQAFLCATAQAQKNELVLCSPAGSSFDLFKNFEERGECFKGMVNNLVK